MFKSCKIQFLKHFYNFYFLNVNISVTASYPFPKFSPLVNDIAMEGRVSQIINLGLSFYLMTKNG